MKFDRHFTQRYIAPFQINAVVKSLAESNIIIIKGGLWLEQESGIPIECRLQEASHSIATLSRYQYLLTNDERRRLLRILKTKECN